MVSFLKICTSQHSLECLAEITCFNQSARKLVKTSANPFGLGDSSCLAGQENSAISGTKIRFCMVQQQQQQQLKGLLSQKKVAVEFDEARNSITGELFQRRQLLGTAVLARQTAPATKIGL